MGYRTVNFGQSYGSLGTVGYRLRAAGGALGTRITAGVAEVVAGSGVYAANVDESASPAGIVWDSEVDSLVVASEDFASSGGGATAAQIWSNATRTLTSFPPAISLATPQPGVGIFIPGARLEGNPGSLKGVTIAGSTVCLRARIVYTDGSWIQQANVTDVDSTVLNLQDDTDTNSDTHTVGSVVFDTLQADGTFTEDGVGYNVAVNIDGDRLPATNTTYRITLTLTTVTGPIKTVWEVQTTDA